MQKVAALLCLVVCFALAPLSAMTWSGDPGPWGPGPMNDCVATWNTYSSYDYNIHVVYSSGTPTADSGYLGQIRFGGSGNYRVAMHEASHWMGTGSTWQWDQHQRWGMWNGAYTVNLRRAYDGPGERQYIYGIHYGPQGTNYDSEGVQGPQMVGIIGAFRRDMDLWGGDQTIGIASDTYRLRNRAAVKMLDSLGATAEGAALIQGENNPTTTQEWRSTSSSAPATLPSVTSRPAGISTRLAPPPTARPSSSLRSSAACLSTISSGKSSRPILSFSKSSTKPTAAP